MEANNLVFLSYATPDFEEVEGFYNFLTREGFNCWLDKRRLKGGQNWDFEIRRALQNSAIIVVFVSENSVDRRGYVQREIKLALDYAEKKLVDDIFIIPVMLDDRAKIPPLLEDRHVIRISDSAAKSNLAESINEQLTKSGATVERLQEEADLHWSSVSYSDKWDGLPGYETSCDLLRFSSVNYASVSEITEVIKGWLSTCLMQNRKTKFEQDTERFDFGQDRFMRQNTWEASCSQPRLKGKVLSIPYAVHWYNAGAAHPNHYFKTFAFTLDPVTQIGELSTIFDDSDAALSTIREQCRSQLLSLQFALDAGQEESRGLDKEFVDAGTKGWEDFSSFVFEEDGIEFMFQPYQVAAYAFGSQFARVDYKLILPHLSKPYKYALGLQYL